MELKKKKHTGKQGELEEQRKGRTTEQSYGTAIQENSIKLSKKNVVINLYILSYSVI